MWSLSTSQKVSLLRKTFADSRPQECRLLRLSGFGSNEINHHARLNRASTSNLVEQSLAQETSTSGRPDLEEPTHRIQKFQARRWKVAAVLKAKRSHVLDIQEKDRPLGEYMALPASQYSVLDAKRIERIDDNTFCCYVGGLKFFGIKVEPVLTVSVVVGAKGPTVKLLSTVLEGSPVIQAANNKFDATMTNVVTWRDSGRDNLKQIKSDAIIEVQLEVPGWMQAIPLGAIEKTGSSVMQKVLDKMLPRFLAQLQADYELWASGDTSRLPVGTGQL